MDQQQFNSNSVQHQIYYSSTGNPITLELIPVSERGRGAVEHTEDEINMYGRQLLELNLEGEDRDLRWIAKQGLEAPVPKDWKAYQSSSSSGEGTEVVQAGQILYVNQTTNQVSLSHPLDPYFKALAKREKLFRYIGMQEGSGSEDVLQNPALLDEECIIKAKEVFSELNQLKSQLSSELQRQIDLKMKDLLLQKALSVQQYKNALNLSEVEREARISQEMLHEKIKILNEQLKAKQDQDISSMRIQFEQKLSKGKQRVIKEEGKRSPLEQERAEENIDTQLQHFKILEKEKFLKKSKEIKEEAESKLNSDQIHKIYIQMREDETDAIQRKYQDKLKKQEEQISKMKIKKDQIINQQKRVINQDLKDKLNLEFEKAKKKCEQQKEELKIDFEANILKEKKQMESKHQLRLVEIEQPNFQRSLVKQTIDAYKRQKEDQQKAEFEKIQKEFQQKIQEEIQQNGNIGEANSIQEIESSIKEMKNHNMKLNHQLRDKVQELQKIIPTYTVRENKFQKQSQVKSYPREFETIGDVEEAQIDIQHSSRVTRQNQRSEVINRNQYPRSPIPSPLGNLNSDVSYMSNLSDPQIIRRLTSHSPSDISSHKLLYFSTPSGESHKSYELIGKFKMKEIKQYVAYELFKSQNKTKELYQEFEKLRVIREDMKQLHQQTQITLPDNEQANARMNKVDADLETQFSQIREYLRSVQSKHDVLRRMREALKKLGNTVMAKARVNIETELLNDYNYLREKTRKDSQAAKEGNRSRSNSPFTNQSNISGITGQSDYERFVEKWEGILKSGMGHNMSNNSHFNEFAVQMIKRDDAGRQTIKRLERGIFELKIMDKKSHIINDNAGIKGMNGFRKRMYDKQFDKVNRDHKEIKHMVEEQYSWLKQAKVSLAMPLDMINIQVLNYAQ